MLDRMNGLQYQKVGYHQIRMHEADCEKMAFQFERGKYEFTRLPFGRKNAPPTFRHLMDAFLEGLDKEAIHIYMDGIIEFSRSVRDHDEHLAQMLQTGSTPCLRSLQLLDASQVALGDVLFQVDDSGGRPVERAVLQAVRDYHVGWSRRSLPSVRTHPGTVSPDPGRNSLILAQTPTNVWARAVLAYNSSLNSDTGMTPLESMGATILPLYRQSVNVRSWWKGSIGRKRIVSTTQMIRAPAGDLVCVRNWYKRRKIDPRFVGPFMVVRKMSRYRLQMRNPEMGRLRIVHANETRPPAAQRQREVVDVKGVRSVIDLINFYRRFLPCLADRKERWNRLTKKGVKFEITDDMLKSLDWAKEHLCREPVLWFPDFTKQFVVKTDASQETHIRRVEIQRHKRELLGVVWAVEYFRPYLWGRQFLIKIDHKPLVWVGGLKETSARVARWKKRLAAYSFTNSHNKGKDNVVADCLSRMVNALDAPTPSPGDTVRSTFRKIGQNQVWELEIGSQAKNRDVCRITDEFVEPGQTYYVYGDTPDGQKLITVLYATGMVAKGSALSRVTKRLTIIEGEEDSTLTVKVDYHVGRGVRETVSNLRRRYYWPKETSQMVTPTPKKPLDVVEADLVLLDGAIRLTLIDRITRFAYNYPLQAMTTKRVRESLLLFLATLGTPRTLVLDGEREFDNFLARSLLEEFRIKQEDSPVSIEYVCGELVNQDDRKKRDRVDRLNTIATDRLSERSSSSFSELQLEVK
ncbi:hypothetical protein AAG570_006235 [Ranatra chinensis]|uniref:Integrase catalytic domain-containing protein n=1 Tax=Ranatra chinensis TaxID=642074 RepID=A0ABD0YVJ5_9HEMI